MTRLLLTLLLLLVPIGAAHADTRAGGGRVPCATVRACRAEIVHKDAAIAWQKTEKARLSHALSVRYQSAVSLGYALAEGLYHVDLRHLGYCESSNDPFARTGQYVSITQQGDNFRARNADVYRLVSIWNPIASILTAARWISVHGSSEWQCTLSGGVKHGGAYS